MWCGEEWFRAGLQPTADALGGNQPRSSCASGGFSSPLARLASCRRNDSMSGVECAVQQGHCTIRRWEAKVVTPNNKTKHPTIPTSVYHLKQLLAAAPGHGWLICQGLHVEPQPQGMGTVRIPTCGRQLFNQQIKGPDNPTSQLLPTSNKRKAKTAWGKQEREKRW